MCDVIPFFLASGLSQALKKRWSLYLDVPLEVSKGLVNGF